MYCIVFVFYETNSMSVSSSREDLPYFPTIRYSVEVLLTTELLVFFKHFWPNIPKKIAGIFIKKQISIIFKFPKIFKFFTFIFSQRIF